MEQNELYPITMWHAKLYRIHEMKGLGNIGNNIIIPTIII